jgi:undecaprenyl-diphosphatase
VTIEQILVLALVQGLTEFLPVSSSAHLILLPELLGWSDQGLAFDVAVHVGTLLAVLTYFRTDIALLLSDWLKSLRQRALVGQSALAWGVLIGTVPVGLVGITCGELVEQYLRSPVVIALATIGFGLVLWVAHVGGTRERDERSLTLFDCFLIGVAQVAALIPGTSRSGVTMSAALALGLTPSAAARFSFLLSIPVIVLAGGSKTHDLMNTAVTVDWGGIGLGVVLSALSAYACIHWFLKFVTRVGLFPFVVYRMLLGTVLLYLYW